MLLSSTQPSGPSWLVKVLIGFVIFVLGFSAVAWNIKQSPDIFTDEIIYSRITVRVSGEGALAWDSGEPFLVHPPLYFLIGGLHHTLFGDPDTPLYAQGDIFATVWNARYLNAFFAGLTAVAFYLLGLSLDGIVLGVLMAILFIIDPFAVRINRRAMLETFTALLALSSLIILFSASEEKPFSHGRILLAGFTAGLALLTKELAIPFLLVILAFGVWESRHQKTRRPLVQSGLVILIAALTYSLYPLWVITAGYGNQFLAEKWLGIRRLLGIVQLTGWNRPEISLTELLLNRVRDYGTTYFLLALGGLAGFAIIAFARQRRSGRLMIAWWAVFYPFFAFLALFGSGNDQFFYFLLFPAISLTSYALFVLPYDRMISSPLDDVFSTDMERSLQAVTISILLLITVPFSFWNWIDLYGAGQDNEYYQMTNYIQNNIPPGTMLNASGDPIKFRYFLPDYPITAAATPQEARDAELRYFFLAPKDVRSGYGRIRPELAEWIQQNGSLLHSESGNSYGDVYFYRVQLEEVSARSPNTLPPGGSAGQAFEPARAGFVNPFITILVLYLLIFGVILIIATLFASKTANQAALGHENQS